LKTKGKKAQVRDVHQPTHPSDTNPIDLGEESDGLSALCAVEDQEKSQGARRGPANASMQHFKDPVPIVDKKRNKCWEFQCHYCPTYDKFELLVSGLDD
jgi:hypothetical protein